MNRIERIRNAPFEVQDLVFQYLIKNGRQTEWGKKYEYDKIRNQEDYRKFVPVSSYEDIFPYIDRMMCGEQNVLWNSHITWFSKSSGTTNAKSKFIPVSREALQDCHYRGGKDLLGIYFTHYPDSNLFAGKSLGIGGSYEVNPRNKNSYYGDISAVIMSNLPKWAEFSRVPGIHIALMSEWESKLDKMADAIKNQNVTNISGVPTWTVVLFEKILEKTGKKNMLEVWPQFEVFFHGAVAFHPYRELFKKFFPSERVCYFETYNASEGFFAFQDLDKSDEMLLMLDHGVYYEFIPVEEFESKTPKTLRLDEVELNKNYALLISTNAGLWRYKIGDTIRFTSLSPFRIKITGRTKHYINAFGEEVVIENAESAMTIACKKTNAIINNFTAAPIYFSETNKGAHEWVVEFQTPPESLEEFALALDEALKQLNSDYEAKRYKDLALQRPIIHAVSEGTFYKWLKKKGKLGGQNKVPRLSNSREFVEEILSIATTST
ncbi:MAG: GH3 auxin-responsive promoter family protein [Cytophagaceae bacterium]|nr:GH3 auxin-responsive promoter family protein [Cytophagaceae bacterium]MDW8456869.1 GH3 auxin-responsive promoter family protein [Cytophagaceae bacterium]